MLSAVIKLNRLNTFGAMELKSYVVIILGHLSLYVTNKILIRYGFVLEKLLLKYRLRLKFRKIVVGQLYAISGIWYY